MSSWPVWLCPSYTDLFREPSVAGGTIPSGGFKLLREKNEWWSALVFVRCTRMPGGEAESQEFGIIHRADVCAERSKVEGVGPKHCMPLSERGRKDSTSGSSHSRSATQAHAAISTLKYACGSIVHAGPPSTTRTSTQ